MADASELIARLEAHVLTTTGGWANERALSEFNNLTRDLMATLDHPSGRQRLQTIGLWAEILYSTRRHRRWERGIAQIRQAIVDDLVSIRSLIS